MRRWHPLPIALIALSVWLLTRDDPARLASEHVAPPTSDRALDLPSVVAESSEATEAVAQPAFHSASSVAPAVLAEATTPSEAPEQPHKPRFAVPSSIVGEQHYEDWARKHLNFSPKAVTAIPGHFPGEDLTVWALVTSSEQSNSEPEPVKCEHLKLTDGVMLVCVPTADARKERDSVEQRVVLELRRGGETLDRVEIRLPFHRNRSYSHHKSRMGSILGYAGHTAVRLAHTALISSGVPRVDALREMRAHVVGGARVFRAAYSPSADETVRGGGHNRMLLKALDAIEEASLRSIDRALEGEADAR